MASETILQHWIFTNFAFPFLLIFFIVFAILEKTKIFGDDKKQLNAMISFIIGLIFVSAVAPKLVVSNLILFLAIAIIVAFVGLLLWGFLAGEEGPKIAGDNFKKVVAGVIIVALVIAVIWAAGWWDNTLSFFGSQNWASSFWTSLLFIIVIAVAIAVAVKSGGSGDK
ncbi:hypothetical protein K9L16_00405 [Candidatus Pacearchaeota archaeon]|nr:hypothetical protein [Candidatus Pacearchaeota archaeon]